MKTLAAIVVCLASMGCGGAATTTPASGPERAAPAGQARAGVDPADFTSPRRNPYFPLTPGLVVRYRGVDEGERLRERVAVTHRTRRIEGVRTRVVRDVVRRLDGTLAEKTRDWYAADRHGNVWYFGEATATYDERGRLEDREGSWQAGRHGARAGLIMPAAPRPTDAYRQEFWRGHAEDQAWIVQVDGVARAAGRRFTHVVRSYEWTRLEPRVVSLKFYGRGVGIIRERDVSGGHERFHAVRVQRP